MISFSKSLTLSKARSSSLTSVEFDYGKTGEKGNEKYAEKVSVKGLSFEQMDKMYLSNPWVRACVDRIVERASLITPLVKPIGNTKDGKEKDKIKAEIEKVNELMINPNPNNESFTNIRKKINRDILKYDAAGIEIVHGKNLRTGQGLAELYSVSGDTIKVNSSEYGMLNKIKAYHQVDPKTLEIVTSFSKDELAYLINNPQSNRVYGLSPLESLIQTVTAELYSSQYNLDFFYNNATPRFAVMMEGLGIGQGSAALKRFRQWWDGELKGNPHKPIIIGTESGKINFEKVGLTNEEMQFQQYSAWLLMKIMVIYKMQPLILGVTDKTATSKDYDTQERVFKTDAVKPLLVLFAESFNRQVVWRNSVLGLRNVYLDFDLDLVDKKEQSEWHKNYAQLGVLTINDIRTKGLGLEAVAWGDVPYLQNNVTAFGAGPNGYAVPPVTNPDGSQANVPNTAVASKRYIEQYVSKNDGLPIGWENVEPNERLEIIEQLLKDRSRALNKYFIFSEKENKK